MLVINRKKNENLVIDDKIVLSVVEIRGDKVRLGIACPKEVPVHRKEIYDLLHAWKPPSRSPEEMGFLQAVLENPDDDGIRLIFADWLEERGNARGEFIRTQCQLANLPAADPRREALEDRERILWMEHRENWGAYLPPVLRSATLERGFVEMVHLSLTDFLDHAEEIFATAPVRRLQIRASWFGQVPISIAALTTSPYLGRLADLDASGLQLRDDGAALLAASPFARGLETLALGANAIQDAGAAALAASPNLAGLITLDLACNKIRDAGARALAASPHLGGLHQLDLSQNELGDTGRQALQIRFGACVRCE